MFAFHGWDFIFLDSAFFACPIYDRPSTLLEEVIGIGSRFPVVRLEILREGFFTFGSLEFIRKCVRFVQENDKNFVAKFFATSNLFEKAELSTEEILAIFHRRIIGE